MIPDNSAAWLNSRPGRLEVGPAPYPTPGPEQIIVRNAAVAINPVDWIIQISRAPVYSWLKDGAVLGTDVAGEVVEVGPAIWESFLPAALADGRYACAAEPHVVGHGLESIQGGMDAQRAGVSAQKLVVTLG